MVSCVTHHFLRVVRLGDAFVGCFELDDEASFGLADALTRIGFATGDLVDFFVFVFGAAFFAFGVVFVLISFDSKTFAFVVFFAGLPFATFFEAVAFFGAALVVFLATTVAFATVFPLPVVFGFCNKHSLKGTDISLYLSIAC